ncbi:hypothetical protein SLEP1_g45580 [Rubroshorea leprosula]|uniref:Uncharacterized protein n=1 Tax=Rubroshorea leprosula TaxID=152421 RepID=A0AAV5LKA1_9ROSI|nr:hypothetical protein SLEP1_g45580 [Rubroshorea leprosula]
MARVVEGAPWTRLVGGGGERRERDYYRRTNSKHGGNLVGLGGGGEGRERGLVGAEEQRTWGALVGLGVEESEVSGVAVCGGCVMCCWLGGSATAGKGPDCFGGDKDWVVATGGLDWINFFEI